MHALDCNMADLFRRLDVQVDAGQKALLDEKLAYPLPVSGSKDQCSYGLYTLMKFVNNTHFYENHNLLIETV